MARSFLDIALVFVVFPPIEPLLGPVLATALRTTLHAYSTLSHGLIRNILLWAPPGDLPTLVQITTCMTAMEQREVADDYADNCPLAADDPLASSGPIYWADEVEQELFFDWTTPDHTDSKPDGEELDDPTDDILFIVPTEDRRFAERDGGFTLFAILWETKVEETDAKLTVAEEADSTPTNLTDPTPPTPPTDFVPPAASADLGLTSTPTAADTDANTDIDIGINTDTFEIYDSDFDAVNEFCTVLQYLYATGHLRLDTYATVFSAAARYCAFGHPFWLNERPVRSVMSSELDFGKVFECELAAGDFRSGLGTRDSGLGTGDWGLGTGDWGLGTGDSTL
ncbi:hypothetical protein BD311DRAFT_837149 [Dichomitus squalens]|uniref:Uncharacterized protein n=1 Tax=Dichomitus squalens TaxID=114155 RepID=A0A4Q9MPE6_9APHY|nr:hypothetical protein BD311DRAFT_837149 [Dichomitus squalens]